MVCVGIMSASRVDFILNDKYMLLENGVAYEGKHTVSISENCKILFDGEYFSSMSFVNANGTFTLNDVTIGVNFHWQQKQQLSYKSNMNVIVEKGMLTIVNVVDVEDYLESVISSEMSATSSLDLLKAHAIISRSWLIRQIECKKSAISIRTDDSTEKYIERWYDHDDHQNFDVCADDHCQRYQGVSRITTDIAKQAVGETSGVVLFSEGEICDARFSKSCGGVTELFENCWENKHHKYLTRVVDRAKTDGLNVDLTDEIQARNWILNDKTEAFCNTKDINILNQVLNDFDLSTHDFFRWKVIIDSKELSELIKSKSGLDFGEIIDLIPEKRGVSGRIYRLQIVGTKKTLSVGKELEIRRLLSKTHLYSSAFVVEKVKTGLGTSFLLHGAGWGHGVGLCQIGAAVMASSGYKYDEILQHYYPSSVLVKNYGHDL